MTTWSIPRVPRNVALPALLGLTLCLGPTAGGAAGAPPAPDPSGPAAGPAPAATGGGAHALVRLSLAAPGAADFLRAHPGLDVVKVKPQVAAEIVAGAADLKLLRDSGLPLAIVQADLETFYGSRMSLEKALDYGIYHNQAEAVALLDSLHAQYPQVVSARWSLGTTHEGRSIWCCRLSDNPDVDEDEPEVLFDGMHHAREIMASEFVLMLAQDLASRYGVDEEITELLDSREIYLVPIVNPDGLAQNDWGGMWRKNRHLNYDGSYGVDLNRNYPYMWGGGGSSGIPTDETYRGPAAGSEPETQAMMALIDAHAFVTGNSFHSFGGLTLYPWGYTTDPAPDGAAFGQLGEWLVLYNGYVPGQPGAVLYPVSGGSIDWSYGDAGHAPIFAFSNEIGGDADGFWPSESRRGPLFQENLWPALCLIRAAGVYLDAEDPVVVGGDGNGRLDAGESAGLSFTIMNRGVRDGATGVVVHLACDDPYVQLGAGERSLGAVAALGSVDLAGQPVPIAVAGDCPDGRSVTVRLVVVSAEATSSATLSWAIGEPLFVFADDFESGTGGWTKDVSWGVTTAQSHSPLFSLSDSPLGDYDDGAATAAMIDAPLRPSLISFWHRYDFESGWDYGRLQVRPSGSGAWATLASYTGTQSTWRQEKVPLGGLAGQEVQVRFLVESDGSVTADGWYLDDVEILGAGTGNRAPAPPALLLPIDGKALPGPAVLTVGPASDPDGAGPVTYGFRVYSDSACVTPVATVDAVVGEEEGAAWTAPVLPPGTYWWRAYAADAEERGLLGETRSFRVDLLSAADGIGPDPRLLVLGPSGAQARLALDLPRAAAVSVRLYDLRGALVRELQAGDLPAGRRVLTWDGRDRAGRLAASGVYLVRARVEGRTLAGRVVLVR